MNIIDLKDIDLVNFRGNQESQNIKQLSHVMDEIHTSFDTDQTITGTKLPWSKTHDSLRIQPQEVSIWAGLNGSGKSLVLGQIMLFAREPTLIISPEMPIVKQAIRLMRQASGTNQPTRDYRERIGKELNEFLWFYESSENIITNTLLTVIKYAAMTLGIKQIVVDSLMKCGIKGSEKERWAGQEDFIESLQTIAKEYNIHIHVVHHLKKGEDVYAPPTIWSIKGTGGIADLVDNAYGIHRNRKKENEMRIAEMNGDQIKIEELRKQPDMTLLVLKQRYGECDDPVALWFNPASLQFTGDNTKSRMAWLQD